MRHIKVISVKKTLLSFKTTSNALKEQPDEHIIATMGKGQLSRNQSLVLSSSSKLTPNIMLLTTENNRLPFRESFMELSDPDEQADAVVTVEPREKQKSNEMFQNILAM